MTRRPGPAFTSKERALIDGLRTPEQVQAWLNAMPYNWERQGTTARTFRGVIKHNTAHCLEAALSAATILEQHGYPPLLMDLESVDLLDHVIFVYQEGKKWGSIGRSRCTGLHGRKPVFTSLRALAKSYSAPFIDPTGRLKGYGLLDLRKQPTAQWRLSPRNVWSIEAALNTHRHHPLPTSTREYNFWKRKFDVWWEAHGRPGHEWPVHYPASDRAKWSPVSK